jgi:hypothetical protein
LRPAEVCHHQRAVTDFQPPRRADADGRLLGSLRRRSLDDYCERAEDQLGG